MLSRTLQRTAWRIPTSTTRFVKAPVPLPAALLQSSAAKLRPASRSYTQSHILRVTTPMAAPTDTEAEAIQNSTGITPETLTQTLKTNSTLSPSHVNIQDISGGCGASFAALIVSDAFKGKSALQRHRLVNGVLKEEIKAIHAWTPRCLTSEQWEGEKAKAQ